MPSVDEATVLADQLLVNGRVYTMDTGWPWASDLAIAGERILAVGESLGNLLAPGGRVIDLNGRCVIPGLIDSHIHFASYATGLHELDVSRASSLGDLQALVGQRVAAAKPGEWLVGHGWDQERWPDRAFPSAADLDAVAPEHPTVLTAKSGHALVTNSRALELAGLTVDTPDPPGGRIGRDAQGRPNGLLFEGSAMRLVQDLAPQPEPEEVADLVRQAFPRAWQVGLTTIHDMGGGAAFDAYQRLRSLGLLGIRVVKYLPIEMLDEALAPLQGAGFDHWLRVAGIKVFADGALGARTAAMLAPYDDEPENTGVLTIEEEALHDVAARALAAGLPLAVHAIGDRANHMVLDVLEDVGSLGEGRLPHRIEHAQLLHPDDVKRFGALGVVASMQPIHATQDAPMADRYWGDRCVTAYAWNSLLRAGATLAFGSDGPVEDINPLLGIHAAVTRRSVDGSPGPGGWYPAERVTVWDAVRAYTLGAAYAGGMDDWVGSLMPGKLADLVVLDRDIFECPPMELAEARALATMIGGKFVYSEF